MSGGAPDARRRRLVAAAPLALAGCTLGSAPRRDFHVLRDAGAPGGAVPGPAIDKVLLVATDAVPGLYDSERMVFSADGRSRSYFQLGDWSERPAQVLARQAEARLVQAQRFRAVASSTSGVRGELLLTLRLDELYLDASLDPGQVRLDVSAELIDWRERKLLARRSFRQSVAAGSRDAPGLALAGSQAMGALLGELVDWTVASAAPPA